MASSSGSVRGPGAGSQSGRDPGGRHPAGGGPPGARHADPVTVWTHGASRSGEGEPAAGAEGPENQGRGN